MMRWAIVGILLLSACGDDTEPAPSQTSLPGYTLPASALDDLPTLYEAISKTDSCISRIEPGKYFCELAEYVPCDTSIISDLTPVESVPDACKQGYEQRTGMSNAGTWCLVGPHIEAPEAIGTEGADQHCNLFHGWAESGFSAGNCSSAAEAVSRYRDVDADSECLAVPPMDLLQACTAFFCSR